MSDKQEDALAKFEDPDKPLAGSCSCVQVRRAPTSRSSRRVPKPAGGSMRSASLSTASTYGNCERSKQCSGAIVPQECVREHQA